MGDSTGRPIRASVEHWLSLPEPPPMESPPGNWVGWALEPRPNLHHERIIDATGFYSRQGRELSGVDFDVQDTAHHYRVPLRRGPGRWLTGSLAISLLPEEEPSTVVKLACSVAQGVSGGLLMGRGTWPHQTLGDRDWIARLDSVRCIVLEDE